MSRTRHHKDQKNKRLGLDFGSRYKHNRLYGGGYGPQAKDAADKERRIESKNIIKYELNGM